MQQSLSRIAGYSPAEGRANRTSREPECLWAIDLCSSRCRIRHLWCPIRQGNRANSESGLFRVRLRQVLVTSVITPGRSLLREFLIQSCRTPTQPALPARTSSSMHLGFVPCGAKPQELRHTKGRLRRPILTRAVSTKRKRDLIETGAIGRNIKEALEKIRFEFLILLAG